MANDRWGLIINSRGGGGGGRVGKFIPKIQINEEGSEYAGRIGKIFSKK